jgi:hypothetical protein
MSYSDNGTPYANYTDRVVPRGRMGEDRDKRCCRPRKLLLSPVLG